MKLEKIFRDNSWLVSWDNCYHIILFVFYFQKVTEYCDYISMANKLCMLWLMEQLKYAAMCQAKPNKHSLQTPPPWFLN